MKLNRAGYGPGAYSASSGPTDTILDSGASLHTVCNEGELQNVHTLENPIEIQGVGGTTTLSRAGQFGVFGPAVLNEGINFNIVSLSVIEAKYRVTYVQNQHYVIHVGSICKIYFRKSGPSGFYKLDRVATSQHVHGAQVRAAVESHVHRMNPTNPAVVLGEHRRLGRGSLTKPELDRAAQVVRMMKNLGHITYDAMRRVLNEGRIIHCPLI